MGLDILIVLFFFDRIPYIYKGYGIPLT